MFPLGRLREPPEAIRRAHAVVISRCRPEREYRGIRRLVGKHNPAASVHTAFLKPLHWVEVPGSKRVALAEMEGRKAMAFCGLGDPASFRRTLDELTVEVVGWQVFRDHHRYSFEEIAEILALARESGAAALVTTEKDVMNLPDGYGKALGGLPIFFLQVRMELLAPDVVASWLDLAFAPKSRPLASS